MDFKQNPDGSASIYSDQEGKEVFRVGGPGTLVGVTGPNQAPANFRGKFAVKCTLNTTGQGTASALVTWQNTTGNNLLVGHTYLNFTTAQTPTINLNVGVGGSALSIDTLLINALSANSTTGIFDNITDKGSGGKSRAQLPANSWFIVCTDAVGSCTSLRGDVYFDVTVA